MTTGTLDPASKSHLPDFNSAAAVPGLSGKVDLRRDTWGIPHVRAASHLDAFAGLGFAHAQDRLWQMEALLRRGTGRYAQWVGKSALAGDMLARQVDTAGASRRDFALLNNDTKAMLEAYARGVNAFIGQGTWPAEYAILGARPATWEPWHSIAVMRQIGFLMGSVWWKLWRAAALPIVGAAEISKLRFDDGGDDMLCIPPGAEGVRYLAALADLKPGLEALLAGQDQQEAEVAGGSNNWALGPQRTATGRPLLAGDPHRVLEMPSMYAQAHLACDDFDVIGLTVPGAPGFPNFGHNGKVAWCVTHAFVDIHDLYVERFDAAVENTSFKGGWKPVKHRAETISVRGENDVTIDVVETMHGPVIAGDPAAGTGLVLRSMQFAVPDTSFDCTLPVLRSSTVEELYDAGREWGLMDHNLVAADTTGRIGNRVRAKVPVRPRSNGWLPVPGWTGEHEWNGTDSVREDAVLHRSGRAGHRHRQQPRDGKRRTLFWHRQHAAASRSPHLAAPRRTFEGDGGGHGVDPSRYRQRHRDRIPRPDSEACRRWRGRGVARPHRRLERRHECGVQGSRGLCRVAHRADQTRCGQERRASV